MKLILKPIFEWLVDQYELFDNPLYNWVIALIIGALGFAFAWYFVGGCYRNGIISGSTAGSVFHWVARFIVVSIIYLLVAAIIWIIKFIITVPWWCWLIVFGILAGILIIVILIKRHKDASTPSDREGE